MLRLVIASGIPAAGFCLVIGLTTLIVKIGGPSGPGQFISAPEALHTIGGRAWPPHSWSADGQPMAIGNRVVRMYRGSGHARRGPFRIGKPGTWGLAWAFSCGRHQAGQFTVTGRSAVIRDDIAAAAWGPAGRGIAWAIRDPGRHVLTVSSRCEWELTVVMPTRRPG